MALFTSRFNQDAAKIADRLAAAKIAVADAGQAVADASYEAALAADPDAVVAPLRDKLAAAERLVATLEAGLAVAEQKEAQRLAEAASAAERARQNSLRQKIGTMITAAEAWREATERQHDAWRAMARANEKVWQGFTAAERDTSALAFDPRRLLGRGENELRMIAQRYATSVDAAAMVTDRMPGVEPYAVRGLLDPHPYAETLRSALGYLSQIWKGERPTPLTVEQSDAARIARLRDHPPKPASPIEVISVLTGYRIAASKAEFDAAVNARHVATVADERAEAQLEQFGRVLPPDPQPAKPTPFSEIEVDRSPEGMAALAAKVRDLVGDSEPDDEGTQP